MENLFGDLDVDRCKKRYNSLYDNELPSETEELRKSMKKTKYLNAVDEVTNTTPATQPVRQAKALSITRASRFLYEANKIMTVRTNVKMHERYAHLERQSIFDSLVDLYSVFFKIHWPMMRCTLDSFAADNQVNGWTQTARVYISCWFRDLYVSNRQAVEKLSSLAYNDKYIDDQVNYSFEYDEFLILLNSSIRPTHIIHAHEDVVYIPLIVDEPDFRNPNPFNIQNFNADYDFFEVIIEVLKRNKKWKMSPLTTNVLGRPSWLFDWHTDNIVCAPFTQEGNYDMNDVTVAYIVGVACTPKLGHKDVDDWQYFQGGVVPDSVSSYPTERISAQTFFGAYNVRTYEIEREYILPCSLEEARNSLPQRPQTCAFTQRINETPTTEPTADTSQVTISRAAQTQCTDPVCSPRYKIVDWIYYAKVIHGIDTHTRTDALSTILFG